MKITIVPSTTNDQPFFQKLDAEGSQQIFQFLSGDQLKQIVEMQYLAKLSSYSSQWPKATTYLVLADHLKVGKIILNKYKPNLHIIDIIIAKRHRNKGFGRILLELVEKEAIDIGCIQVSLSVANNNSAKNLYVNLGYKVTGENESHFAMQKQLVQSDLPT